MKRLLFSVICTLLVSIVFLGKETSAKTIQTPDWFIEHTPGEISNLSLPQSSELSTDLDESNYHFLHNMGKSLEGSDVNIFIDGEIDATELEGFEIIGVGKTKINGKIFTDFIYSNSPKDNYEDLIDSAVNKAQETLVSSSSKKSLNTDTSINSTSNLIEAASTDHIDSHTFNVYDPNHEILAGVFTSNVDYLYKGFGTLNGNVVSLWDVKYFNQSIPKNDYQTREIITRFNIAPFSDQTLRSYGPFTTGTNSSASVSLTGIVPSFAWNFDTDSSRITDTSSIPEKYARWTFKTSLGSTTAKSNYVVEPGARITNRSGKVSFTTTHNLDYYKNLNSQAVINTGPITRSFDDR